MMVWRRCLDAGIGDKSMFVHYIVFVYLVGKIFFFFVLFRKDSKVIKHFQTLFNQDRRVMKKHIPQLDVKLSQNLVEPETERILGILDKYLDENYGNDLLLFENARDFQEHSNIISQIIQDNQQPAAESTSSVEDSGKSPTPSADDESETPSTLPNIAAKAPLPTVASTSGNHSSSTPDFYLGKERNKGKGGTIEVKKRNKLQLPRRPKPNEFKYHCT